ncbi:MAG: hypothetical protein V1708_06325 [Candidatus Micrarchaeota archaeon]
MGIFDNIFNNPEQFKLWILSGTLSILLFIIGMIVEIAAGMTIQGKMTGFPFPWQSGGQQFYPALAFSAIFWYLNVCIILARANRKFQGETAKLNLNEIFRLTVVRIALSAVVFIGLGYYATW